MSENEKKIIENFPIKIKRFRISQGYTQEQMAAELDVSVSTYKKYETSKGIPSVDVLMTLRQMSNKSMEFFVSEERNTTDELWVDLMSYDDKMKLDLFAKLISYFGYDTFKDKLENPT